MIGKRTRPHPNAKLRDYLRYGVERQNEIGALGIDPPEGLTAKVQAIASAGQMHNRGKRAA
jgi:hypothetical protein